MKTTPTHLLAAMAAALLGTSVPSHAANSFTDLGQIGPDSVRNEPFQSNTNSLMLAFNGYTGAGRIYRNGEASTLPQPAGLSGYRLSIWGMTPGGTIFGTASKTGATSFRFRWNGEANLTELPIPNELGAVSHILEDGLVFFSGVKRWSQADGLTVIPEPALPAGAREGRFGNFYPARDGQSGVGIVEYKIQNAKGAWRRVTNPYRWTPNGGSVLLETPGSDRETSCFIRPVRGNMPIWGGEGFAPTSNISFFCSPFVYLWSQEAGFVLLNPRDQTLEQTLGSAVGGRKGGVLDYYAVLAGFGVNLEGDLSGLPELHREGDSGNGAQWVSPDGKYGIINFGLKEIRLWRKGTGFRPLLDVLEATLPEAELQTLRQVMDEQFLYLPFGSSGSGSSGVNVTQLPGKPGHVRMLLQSGRRFCAVEVDMENLPAAKGPDTLSFVTANGVKPLVTFSESWSDIPKKTWNEKFEEQASSQMSLVLPLSGFDPATVTADTEISLRFGKFAFSRKLSEALNYTAGASKASFKLSSNPKASKAQMDVAWTAKSLSIKIAYAVKATNDEPANPLVFVSFPSLALESRSNVYWWETRELQAGFAGLNASTGLNVKFAESYVVNSVGESRRVSASTSLNLGMPTLTLQSPKPKALVLSPSVSITATLNNFNENTQYSYFLRARANQGEWTRHWDPHIVWSFTLPKNWPIAFEHLPLKVGENLLEVQVVEKLTGRVIQSNSLTVWHAGVAGDFYGLMADGLGSPVGTLAFKVTDKRSLTGSLVIQGKKYALKGTVDADGVAVVPVKLALNQTVNLVLTFDTGGALSVAAVDLGSGQLAGQIGRLASQPLFNPTLMEATRIRTIWNLSPHPDAPDEVPPGTGYGVLDLSYTRTTKLAGRLADGTAFTHSGRLTEAGELVIFLNLYSKPGGGLSGTVAFDGSADPSEVWRGDLWWNRPAGVSKTLYPQGFQTRLRVTGTMNGGVPELGALPSDYWRSWTAAYHFTGGGFPPEGVSVVSDFNGRPKVAELGFKLTIGAESLLRFGTFRDPSGKIRNYYLVPNWDTGRWEGFFVGDTSAGRAEWVLLEP
jgi:hypothetical protein